MKKTISIILATGLIFSISAFAATPNPTALQTDVKSLQNDVNSLNKSVTTLKNKTKSNKSDDFTTYPITDSNNVKIGTNLGVDSSGVSRVVFNDGVIKHILAFKNGIYLITDKTVYFNDVDCTGEAYVENFNSLQSDLAASVIFYPLGGLGGADRALYTTNPSVVTGLLEKSKYSESVGACENESHTLTLKTKKLNTPPLDLVALHPNPKVVFP